MTDQAQADRLPVSVLTGFLGSGKTTLLNHIVRQPEMENAVVVINEFGEIGLDHLLMESAEETIVELSSGCLCCTVRGDLVETLGDLWSKRVSGRVRPFDRVVIETTGLADPAPILHTIMTDDRLAPLYALNAVVTVVDAINGDGTLDAHREAVKQAAVADCLVLSKTDLAEGDGAQAKLERLRRRLSGVNPGASMIEARHGRADAGVLFGGGVFNLDAKSDEVIAWLNAEAYDESGHDHDHNPLSLDHGLGARADDAGHHHDVNRHSDEIQAYCITLDKPISPGAFNFFIEILAGQRGEDMLRLKGLLNVEGNPDTPAVVHGVQHLFHPVRWLDAWPSADRRSRLVFITRNIRKDQIEPILAAIQGELNDGASAETS